MFSRRLPDLGHTNALTRLLDGMRETGTPIVDLTESNPTRVALSYPRDLLAALADERALLYEPQPLGAPAAREAIAADCARRGVTVDPAQVVLTASTSEAYSWLFKVLCDPGDAVLVPRPSYPLFEHLTRLEGVETASYDLDYHGRWSIDFTSLDAAPPRTRAVLVVSPNNPTGSYLSAAEFARLVAVCRERGWALIADEVFADYVLDATAPFTDLAARTSSTDNGILSVTLSGASKSLGLPQVKLGWMVVGGPPQVRDPTLRALELVADTFLSVSTPVQCAAPDLLRRAGVVRRAIHQRIRSNLDRVRSMAAAFPACEVLRVEGGWSAVIRVPATSGEEQLALDLLQQERILVHPGYFFDFAREAFVVVSLLPEEDVFAGAVDRVLRFASR